MVGIHVESIQNCQFVFFPFFSSNPSLPARPLLQRVEKAVRWHTDEVGLCVATQPFQEILHERVLKYQDSLFEARTINVNARKELPIETAEVRLFLRSLAE